MTLDLTKHPCFNGQVKKKYGRIHLPVAPKCNIQCNFCNRKYDCVNESRPGVTSGVLTPKQALAYCKEMVEKDQRLTVVGIAGPGDPFANSEETMETLRLIRAEFPEMLLCVATNGLNAAPYVKELSELKVSHLTITINAVDAEIGQHVYSWVRDGKKIYRGKAAGEILLQRQLELLEECKKHNLTVKINSILIPGINDEHIPEVAKKTAEMGADLFNCIGMCNVPDTPFKNIAEPSTEHVNEVRQESGKYLNLMLHCTRCRADAAGCLGESLSAASAELLQKYAAGPTDPTQERLFIAVATREGLLVNLHLGQAQSMYIYGQENSEVKLKETRPCPPSGGGDLRWELLGQQLSDCRALLVTSAGDSPITALEKTGLKVIRIEGLILQIAGDLFAGKTIRPATRPHVCGNGCGGNKVGCG